MNSNGNEWIDVLFMKAMIIYLNLISAMLWCVKEKHFTAVFYAWLHACGRNALRQR